MEAQRIKQWGSWIAAKPIKPGVFRKKEGGFLVRGRVTDPRTGKLKEIRLTVVDGDALDAYKQLQEELANVRNGLPPRTSRERIRLTEYAASLFERKVKRGKIKSAKSREKWESTTTCVLDIEDRPLILFDTDWALRDAIQTNPALTFIAAVQPERSTGRVAA